NWDTGRIIATYNGSSGIPFRYGSLTETQKNLLNSNATTAQNILNFLRGDRSLEKPVGTFRDRFSVLGDIIHSSPVFENGVLYTGGNDGMLHAFSATDGSEIFAYVPNLVFPRLKNLTDPAYYGNHTYYVDLSPVIQPGVDQGESTMTLLVGGLAKGGKGYYAIDVSDPASMNTDANVASKVLWEYGNDDDLGYSYARPAIVDSNDDNLNANGTGWMVIAGNGYNSENGRAVLLIFDPSNGQLLKRIDTGVGSCNGLSTPVVIDVNYDDRVDYVYAGDLKGNLWKFDLTNSDYTKWGVAFGVDSNSNGSINYSEGDDPEPLFQAPGQPITTKPDVMRHPERHGYIVVFGTGKYLGSTDYKNHSVNTIYGIWDYGDDSDDSEYLGSLTDRATGQLSYPTGTSLLKQEIVLSTEDDQNFWTVGENKLRILTDNPPNWMTTTDPDDPGYNPDPVANAGWYFDLPLTGERMITDVMIRDAKAIVITFTPEEAPCSIGGDSIVHEMDAASGGRLLVAQFDIGGAAAIDSEDLINIGTEASPEWVAPTGIQKTGRLHAPAILRMGSTEMKYFSSSEGTIKRVREKPPKVGVRYWRELE
ncbi:MAG: PQQ-binding-like beta-propeller repeat protein, partial [Deltaproteobacteria bacterium]|nr:PQQ-binding-like beta-propeller repeat protein [Deltaproteobacteria bacterium]